MNARSRIAALVAAALALPAVPLAADGLRYSGSSTIGQSILEAAGAKKAFEARSGITFASFEVPGSGKGIEALIAGKVNVAGASRPLKPAEKAAGVLGTVIGYDAVAVFVHKDNPVKDLSKEQLKAIFTGKIRNWKEVGGKDAPIAVNTEIQGAKRATMEMFNELVMDKAPYAAGFKEIDLPRDQIVEVARNPNGIGTPSLGLLAAVPADVRASVKAILVDGIGPTPEDIQSGAYLISRPLNLATMGPPKGDAKALVDFLLSPAGQAFVAKDFVPVRKR
ncbi:MAG: phosphate ABC transporter substrate-binding protein [Anaeromyxobacteraceae bacterium]|nr:phosphate ABC transporter substrate-binding protein [Anaeromyxobacteraceae bacterium]